MFSPHLNLTPHDLNYRDLEVLCAVAYQRSTAPNLLGRTITVWDNAGSRIRKFAQGCLKAYRTAALRAAAIEGGSEIDFTHIKKYENYLGKTGLVMSYLSYANTLISLKNLRAEILVLGRQVDREPSNSELRELLSVLRARQTRLKKEIGASSAILGLGMGSMLCQTMALKGLRAAPYIGAVIGGVETFINLGSKLNGLCKIVNQRGQRTSNKKNQEQQIRDLYLNHRPNLNLQLSRSAGLLRDMRFIKVQKKHCFSIYTLAISIINWVNLLVNSAATSILIAGVFGAVAGTAAIGSLNIASLALLGIGLAAIALKWIHANQLGWRIDLSAIVNDWKIQNREKIKRDLSAKIEILNDTKKNLLKKKSWKKKQEFRLKMSQIDAELTRLSSIKKELINEKMGSIFRSKFGNAFDLQNVELLKDAALNLRNESAGIEYLKEFFHLFGQKLGPAQLKNDQDMTLSEMGDLFKSMDLHSIKESIHGLLTDQQREMVQNKDLSFLSSLSVETLASLEHALKVEREQISRIDFLKKFGSLFAAN